MGRLIDRTVMSASVAMAAVLIVLGGGLAHTNQQLDQTRQIDISATGLHRHSDIRVANIRRASLSDIDTDPITTGGVSSDKKKSNTTKNGSTHRSGVFGSVAIPFGNIATRQQWNRSIRNLSVSTGAFCGSDRFCRARQAASSRIVKQATVDTFYKKLQRINAAANKMVRYRPDKKGYNSFDHWAAPSETIQHGFGDCEDYAILKMALLTEAGVPSSSMSLVVLKDVRRNLYHAVLAVHTNKGAFILDNNQKRVLADKQLPNYLPLYSFSQKRSWIHGWKRSRKNKLAQVNSLDLSSIQPGESIYVEPVIGTEMSDRQLAFIEPATAFAPPSVRHNGWIRTANNPL